LIFLGFGQIFLKDLGAKSHLNKKLINKKYINNEKSIVYVSKIN